MRMYTSKLSPDSVVTYLFHDCKRSHCVIVLPSVVPKYSTPRQTAISSARVRNV